MDTDIYNIVCDTTKDLIFKPLTIRDESEIFNFLKENEDFALLESGQPPQQDAGRAVFSDLPPSKTLDDKFVVGVIKDKKNVALLDILRDHPEKDIWWIGLMLIHPLHRGLGLGRTIFTAVENSIHRMGAKEIRLGVLEENASGYGFWQRMGFIQIDSKPGRVFGKKIHTVKIMSKTNKDE